MMMMTATVRVKIKLKQNIIECRKSKIKHKKEKVENTGDCFGNKGNLRRKVKVVTRHSKEGGGKHGKLG